MQRYCFTSTLSSWHDLVKEAYSPVSAGVILQLKPTEGCVQVTDSAYLSRVQNINRQLAETNGFTPPHYTPKWYRIAHNNGPYIPGDQLTVVPPLRLRNNVSIILVTAHEKDIIQLYAQRLIEKQPIDDVFKRNYWESIKSTFHKQPSKSLDDINWTDYIEKLNKSPIIYAPVNQKTFGQVTVDGIDRLLTTFSVPSGSLIYRGDDDPQRGTYRRPIMKDDISLNSAVPISGFNVVNEPGASWASKYIDPFTKTAIYSFIIFDDELVEIESESSVNELQEEAEQRERRLMERQEEESNQSYGEEEEEEEFEEAEIEPPEWIQRVEEEQEYQRDPDTVPDFDNLTLSERNLPLAYVLSRLDQWRIVLTALMTKFANVINLPKVSDSVLSTIADAITVGKVFNPNGQAILAYAHQRNV